MDVIETLQQILDESKDPGNPGAEELLEIMHRVKRIAVVGISRNPEKAARRVPSYLVGKGYEVIPVNPFVDRVLGKEARDSLEEVTEPLDMVLVFRPSKEAATIARTAMGREEKPVIWLQEGIRADDVAQEARSQGIQMVQDLCAYRVRKAMED